jgi:hypothetical protein
LQSHTGASTVLIGELDAGDFKRTPQSQIVRIGHRGLIFG